MPTYRRILVIVNPQAGQRSASRVTNKIEEHFTDLRVDFEIRTTDGAGDALRWARAANAEGFDLIAVAGGDGTVREAVEGLMRSGARIPLAVIPTGTGNVIAHALTIPALDLGKSLQVVTTGKAVRFDIGYLPVHDRYFVFVAGTGYDARLIHDTPRELKKTLGFFAYVASGIKHLFTIRPIKIELEMDNRIRRVRAHTVMVVNIGRFANIDWSFAPNVSPHDGKLNITVMSTSSIWGSLTVILRILTKRHFGYADLLHYRAERIRVTSDSPLPVEIDGEPLGTTPFLAEVIPDRMQFIVPESYSPDGQESA